MTEKKNVLLARKYKILVGDKTHLMNLNEAGEEPEVIHDSMINYYDVIFLCVEEANKRSTTISAIDLTDSILEEFPPGCTITDQRK